MNIIARFDEIPAMILQDIKEIKRYGRTGTRTDGQREHYTVCVGIAMCEDFVSGMYMKKTTLTR